MDVCERKQIQMKSQSIITTDFLFFFFRMEQRILLQNHLEVDTIDTEMITELVSLSLTYKQHLPLVFLNQNNNFA